MLVKQFGYFLWYSFALALITLLVFGTLRWLNIPSGQLIDWIIGLLSVWWLLAITTIPWNVYFDAEDVIDEANRSKESGILIDEKNVSFAGSVSRKALILAIFLHIVSAVGLFLLSFFSISPIGYVGSAAALLLTGLRPAARGYRYLKDRLGTIRHQVKYPREDVVELRERTSVLESELAILTIQLDPSKSDSFARKHEDDLLDIKQKLASLAINMDKIEQNNQVEHDRIRRETESAVANLSNDSIFLDHVREILRFIKSA